MVWITGHRPHDVLAKYQIGSPFVAKFLLEHPPNHDFAIRIHADDDSREWLEFDPPVLTLAPGTTSAAFKITVKKKRDAPDATYNFFFEVSRHLIGHSLGRIGPGVLQDSMAEEPVVPEFCFPYNNSSDGRVTIKNNQVEGVLLSPLEVEKLRKQLAEERSKNAAVAEGADKSGSARVAEGGELKHITLQLSCMGTSSIMTLKAGPLMETDILTTDQAAQHSLFSSRYSAMLAPTQPSSWIPAWGIHDVCRCVPVVHLETLAIATDVRANSSVKVMMLHGCMCTVHGNAVLIVLWCTRRTFPHGQHCNDALCALVDPSACRA